MHQPTVYWQDYRYNGRRFANTDPIPGSGEFVYPGFWSRYKFYTDYLNPSYWRKYRDPYYDRPLWDSWKPYLLDQYNTKRAIGMYRQGLISFDYLDKNWIEPTALARKGKDWGDVYSHGGGFSTDDSRFRPLRSPPVLLPVLPLARPTLHRHGTALCATIKISNCWRTSNWFLSRAEGAGSGEQGAARAAYHIHENVRLFGYSLAAT